eukprot:scaffold58745_cov66-Phaeocystis_antarctica.AAC.6
MPAETNRGTGVVAKKNALTMMATKRWMVETSVELSAEVSPTSRVVSSLCRWSAHTSPVR